MSESCHGCGSAGGRPVYAVERVPVHSVLNLRTREQAQSFPAGRLRLSVCPVCGLIQNNAFDPATQRFGPDYEETQGCSPRFREFQEELARRFMVRHGLRGRRLLEIGCGKGDFLNLLCRLGGNTGTGYDPAWLPRGEPAPGAVFVPVLYGPEHAGREVDFVCCNMTLEHIGQPLEFLRQLRANLEGAGRPAVFLMVPEAGRILREAAFWDVYYEHCNYFTPGSLARMCARAGFDVQWAGLEFEGQYAAVECRPAAGQGRLAVEGLDNPGQMVRAAEGFGKHVAGTVRLWREWMDSRRAGAGRVALWGGGSKAVAFLTAVGGVDAVVDINPHRQDAWLPGSGLRVGAPGELCQLRPRAVIVMNPAYREEIRGHLHRLGLRPELAVLGETPGTTG